MSELDLPKPGASVRFIGPLLRAFAWGLFLVLGPVAVRNRRRIPKAGGVLILANHLADIDPIVVQMACPRHIHFMGKSELFPMRGVGAFMRWWGAFPVKRGEPDRAALKVAIELIRAGEMVCIFPEGQLSESGCLQDLLPGASLIARSGGGSVMCIGLRNTNRVMPYGKVIPRPAWCRVWAQWGEPRPVDKATDADELMAWARAELIQLGAKSEPALAPPQA